MQWDKNLAGLDIGGGEDHILSSGKGILQNVGIEAGTVF